jgi:hypothetical protein
MLEKFWPFGLFYIHFVYFVAIWYILWLFGIFFLFWYVVQRKIWQPCARRKIHCSCGQTFTAYTSLHISNIFIYYIYILSYIFTYLQISYMRIFTTYRCTKYLTTGVAEEHGAFGVSVTVGTGREIFASRFHQKSQEMI